jgi:hypothetical protein
VPYRVIDEPGFKGGVNTEVPPWLLPPGSLALASNLIFDLPGVARQRGGTTALSALGSIAATGTSLGFAYSTDAGSSIEELYLAGGNTGGVYIVNKSTGAVTVIAASGVTAGTIGRPTTYFGFVVFPGVQNSVSIPRTGFVAAGQLTTTSFVNSANATTVANNGTITLAGGTTANIAAGAVASFANTGGAGEIWEGRVVAVTSATTVTVWPAPTFTGTAAAGFFTTAPYWSGHQGACVTTFQNRLLYGNVWIQSSTPVAVADRRVQYSALPVETLLGLYSGAASMRRGGEITPENYFDVPGAHPIVALEAVSDDELLILTTEGVIVFSGTLATQTDAAASGVTWDLSPLNTNAGCLSDLSVQRTPHGILWASAEGIMAYTGGGKLQDLTEGRMHTYWRNLTRGSSFAVHGSAYVRNHYVVSGSSGGSTFVLAYNLDNGTWAPLTSALDFYYAVARPTDPSQVYALRFGTGSFTNGQTVRADSAFAPDVWGQTKTDSDGSVVAFSGVSRSITDDAATERIVRRVIVRSQSQMTGANVSVRVGARLDSTDTTGTEDASVGSLSNTGVLLVNAASNATPIVITTNAAHGYQSEDTVDIHGATPNTAANGRWRITVINTTQFSLNGSIGNGATAAAGDVKRTTEQEFIGTGVDIGQATFVSLASTGTVNRFEWHGLRIGAMEITRGMG